MIRPGAALLCLASLVVFAQVWGIGGETDDDAEVLRKVLDIYRFYKLEGASHPESSDTKFKATECKLDNLPDDIDAGIRKSIEDMYAKITPVDEVKIEAHGLEKLIDTFAKISGNVTTSCFKKLGSAIEEVHIKDKQKDDVHPSRACGAYDEALTALRRTRGNQVKNKWFVDCLKETDKCSFYSAVMDQPQCFKSQTEEFRQQFAQCEKGDLSPIDALGYTRKVLTEIYGRQTDSGRRQFITALRSLAEEDPNLMKYVPCDTGQYIWEIAKDLLTSTCDAAAYSTLVNSDDFWIDNHFLLPFMDEETCSQITYATIKSKKTILETLSFMCEKLNCNEDPDPSEFEVPYAMRYARLKALKRRHGAQCESICGKALLTTVMAEATWEIDWEADLNILENLMFCQTLEEIYTRDAGDITLKCHFLTANVIANTKQANNYMLMKRLKDKCKETADPATKFNADKYGKMACTALIMVDELDTLVNVGLFCAGVLMSECMSTFTYMIRPIMSVCTDWADAEFATMNIEMYGDDTYLSGGTLTIDDVNKLDRLASQLRLMDPAERLDPAYRLVQLATTPILKKRLFKHKVLAELLSLSDVRTIINGTSMNDLITEDLSGTTPAQKSILLHELITENDIQSITLDNVIKMGPLAVALNIKTINENISPVNAFDVMQHLCKLKGMTGKQSEAASKRLLEALADGNPSKPLDVLHAGLVWAMRAECFTAVSPEQLSVAKREVRHSICSLIGRHPTIKCLLPGYRRAQLARVCVNEYDKDDTTRDYDTWRNNEHLLADAPTEFLDTFSGDILQILPQLRPSVCLPSATRTKIIEILDQQIFPENMTKYDVLTALGEFAYLIHTTDHATYAEEMSIYINPESFNPDDNYKENVECCMGEMSHVDLISALNYQNDIAEKHRDILIAAESDELTCAAVAVIGNGSALEVAHINTMTLNEFSKCFYRTIFGKLEGVKLDVAETIMNKFLDLKSITTDGICDNTIIADEVENLGALAVHLTVEKIECLLVLSANTRLGYYTRYTKEQLDAFAAKYFELNPKDMEDLTCMDVAILKNFVCGLTAEQIHNLTEGFFRSCSALLGNLMCPLESLRPWLELAKAEFGAVHTWKEQYAEIGNLLGALDQVELNSADKLEAVPYWTPRGISLIPVSVIQNLHPAYGRYFNLKQLVSLTDAQLDALISTTEEDLSEAEKGDQEGFVKHTELGHVNGGDSAGDNDSDNTGGNAGINPGDNAGSIPGDNAGINPFDNALRDPDDYAGSDPGDNALSNPGGNAGSNPGGGGFVAQDSLFDTEVVNGTDSEGNEESTTPSPTSVTEKPTVPTDTPDATDNGSAHVMCKSVVTLLLIPILAGILVH